MESLKLGGHHQNWLIFFLCNFIMYIEQNYTWNEDT